MTNYTAEQVIAQRGYLLRTTGLIDIAHMLDAFADLLRERESAQCVAVVRQAMDGHIWLDWDVEVLREKIGEKLYLHPPRESAREAKPNDDKDADSAIKHHVFIYEVDFGDEGKGRYVRLNDFDRVVKTLEAGRESAKPVAGCVNADGKLCDPFMTSDVIDEAIWSEPDVVPLYTHPQRKSAPVVPDALPDLDPAEGHAKGEAYSEYQIGRHDGWNECREAMLKSLEAKP